MKISFNSQTLNLVNCVFKVSIKWDLIAACKTTKGLERADSSFNKFGNMRTRVYPLDP